MASPDSKMTLRIVTPQGVVFTDEDVQSATLMTESGEITVLPRHIPLVSIIVPGEMIVRKPGSQLFLAIAHGILEIRQGSEVVVLADRAEYASDLNQQQAQEARKKAADILEQSTLTEREQELYQKLLEKEDNRLEVIRRHQEREGGSL